MTTPRGLTTWAGLVQDEPRGRDSFQSAQNTAFLGSPGASKRPRRFDSFLWDPQAHISSSKLAARFLCPRSCRPSSLRGQNRPLRRWHMSLLNILTLFSVFVARRNLHACETTLGSRFLNSSSWILFLWVSFLFVTHLMSICHPSQSTQQLT